MGLPLCRVAHLSPCLCVHARVGTLGQKRRRCPGLCCWVGKSECAGLAADRPTPPQGALPLPLASPAAESEQRALAWLRCDSGGAQACFTPSLLTVLGAGPSLGWEVPPRGRQRTSGLHPPCQEQFFLEGALP